MPITMHSRIRARITDEIIDGAIRNDSRNCMIANAVKAAYPNFKNVIADTTWVRWTNPDTGSRYYAPTPSYAAEALLWFDEGTRPHPFWIKLRAAITRPSGRRSIRRTIVAEPDGRQPDRSPRLQIDGGRAPRARRRLPGQLRGDRIFGARLFIGGYAQLRETIARHDAERDDDE